jgi:hypothetical protein
MAKTTKSHSWDKKRTNRTKTMFSSCIISTRSVLRLYNTLW